MEQKEGGNFGIGGSRINQRLTVIHKFLIREDDFLLLIVTVCPTTTTTASHEMMQSGDESIGKSNGEYYEEIRLHYMGKR